MVSYARSTYEKSKKFNERLKELQKTISPSVIRAYLVAANIQKEGGVELNLDISEEQKAQLDELNKLRMDGIQSEMRYALAQAKKNGIQLSEQVLSGRELIPGFNRELLEKVPSFGVYNLFIPFTEEEFDIYYK